MSEPFRRVADELRRLDDELAAAVTLPTPDSVIRRAGVFNRASTAAAVAVLSVGALGAMTAVASVAAPVVPAATVAPPASVVSAGPLTSTTTPAPVTTELPGAAGGGPGARAAQAAGADRPDQRPAPAQVPPTEVTTAADHDHHVGEARRR